LRGPAGADIRDDATEAGGQRFGEPTLIQRHNSPILGGSPNLLSESVPDFGQGAFVFAVHTRAI
jgi:hypothetical protein